MTTVESFPGTRLLNRLSTYPLLNDSYSQAMSYYNWVKTSSPYVAKPLNLAESGLKKAVETSTPVIQKFNGQLNVVEDIACTKLGEIETRYPSMLKPTKELYVDGKGYVDTKVQPLVQPISNTYSSVKEYGSKTVDTLVHSSVAKKGYTLLEQVVDAADGYADKYLPEDETADEEKCQDKKDLLTKSFVVKNKVQKRMYSKAMKGLQQMKLRSDESLKKLHFTVDLMEYAKTQVNDVKGTVGEIYEEISQEYAEEVKQEVEADKETDESAILKKTRAYANTVRLTVLATSTVFFRHLSEENQNRLTKAKNYSEEFYAQLVKSKTFTDLSDTFLIKSRKTLQFVQDTLDTTFKYLLVLKDQYLNKRVKPSALEAKEEPKDSGSSSSSDDSED